MTDNLYLNFSENWSHCFEYRGDSRGSGIDTQYICSGVDSVEDYNGFAYLFLGDREQVFKCWDQDRDLGVISLTLEAWDLAIKT